MKKLLQFIILLFLCFPIISKAVTNEYVIDKADVLTDDAESYIMKYSDYLYKTEKIDFYVISVDYIDLEYTIEEYTDGLYSDLNISDKGLIILVSKDDRKIRIQAGKELSHIINNDKIDEFMKEYFLPYMEHSEWNDGIINGYSAIYKYICEEYNIDASSMEVEEDIDFLIKYKTPLMIIIMILCSVFATQYQIIFRKKGLNNNTVPILVVLILLNIIVISFAYVLEPVYLIFALAIQGIFMYMKFSTTEKRPYHRRKVTKKVRKRKKKS